MIFTDMKVLCLLHRTTHTEGVVGDHRVHLLITHRALNLGVRIEVY